MQAGGLVFLLVERPGDKAGHMAMDTDRILEVVTCVASLLTFFSVTLTVLPHMKEGLAIVRDIVLWIACMAVLGSAVWLGVQHVRAEGVPSAVTRLSSLVKAPSETPAEKESQPAPAGDPYYRAPTE